jgi:hypothetical protein
METNRELTAIEVAIKLSKVSIFLRILLHRLNQNLMFMNSIPVIVFDEERESLRKIISGAEYQLESTEKHIYGFIKPFLGTDDYNYPGKYSFSSVELVRGFATIERVLRRNTTGNVTQSIFMALLLSTHKDNSPSFNLTAGTIISFEGHKDILETLPSVITQKELEAFLKPNYSCTFNIEHLFPK